jgi:hypothetical protein
MGGDDQRPALRAAAPILHTIKNRAPFGYAVFHPARLQRIVFDAL